MNMLHVLVLWSLKIKLNVKNIFIITYMDFHSVSGIGFIMLFVKYVNITI